VASHEAKSSFACRHCDRKFVFKNSLKKHVSKGRCEALKSAAGGSKRRASAKGGRKSEPAQEAGNGSERLESEDFPAKSDVIPNFVMLDFEDLLF
jgi:hypothetical protein